EIILHLDKYLQAIVADYSALTYLLLFLIIFLETGVVIFPFLPGDSLLFVAGALAATGTFNIEILFLVILIAAITGDALNYHIGKFAGPKIFNKEKSLLFNKEHLAHAQKFYEKYGKKTIIIARFIPIIRTFAPFVAGIGAMPYRTFLIYNVIGALLWCVLFILGGFSFGNIPWVQAHFGSLILAIIFVSLLPVAKELISHLIEKKRHLN
ncbi:MAG: DedA family protein, partial [Candidatus Gracilibacteria bacterium]